MNNKNKIDRTLINTLSKLASQEKKEIYNLYQEREASQLLQWLGKGKTVEEINDVEKEEKDNKEEKQSELEKYEK